MTTPAMQAAVAESDQMREELVELRALNTHLEDYLRAAQWRIAKLTAQLEREEER